VIAVHEVTKRFGATPALDAVSLDVRAGTTHVLLGSSGSGKSTVLRLILGLTWPDAGSVRVDGTPVEPATRDGLLARMGYVVQDGGLYPHLTAFENVALAAEAQRWPRARIAARVGELADLAGLDGDMLRRYPRELSGGQRQRVGLMRALVLDPPILLLDEPLGALDPIVRAELQEQLGRLFARLAKTVVLVTHDIREAARLGHTITLLTARATALGRMLGVVVVAALAAYVLLKLTRRRLFLRKLRMARISPEALKLRLDAGEDVTIIDLRTPLAVTATPYAIPGSRWLAAEAIDAAEAALLGAREVVLYCACPNEATSARIALLLKRQGITRVRPLEGGLAAWMARGFPVLAVEPPALAVDEREDRAPARAA